MAEKKEEVKQSDVVKACEKAWGGEWTGKIKNSSNCSGFLKAVAHELGVSLVNRTADGIIDDISTKWTKLKSGEEAARNAQCKLVVAGLKAADHDPKKTQGHVAVVVPGPLYRGKYPKCWCGSTGTAQSKGTKSVGEVWNAKDRDKVSYYKAT